MEKCWQPLLLLLLVAVAALNTHGSNAAVVKEDKLQVKKITNKPLQVIPHSSNSSSVTKLLIEGSLITLNEADRLALGSYPALIELHLDGNRVSSIPAKYFSVVPHLKVLSLSKNNISSLDPESFSGLDFLTELDLSNNLLTSLPTQLFRGLSNLQMLSLQGNPWNCSCPLLSTIEEVKAIGVTIGSKEGPKVICASLENQAGRDFLEATAACYPSPPTTITTHPQKLPAVSVKKSWGSSIMLKTASNQTKDINKGPAPVSGNTWKFAACVAVLALCTCMLIVCAIKGPSWYKLFHNYRHRRLHSIEDETGVVSTVFSKTGRHLKHQTFTFERENGQMKEVEEEEDGYFEDPYIKTEE
ncbi:leucine-rich repeat-containing protein 19-like [Notolabrus celidotus]|uniref:leucine-rich repeat-containing protein 19-like n=1 Tax=Notolabrus celidotus TaxID=1203425 RepID=UPI0014900CD5|nr:leucine-rich repeat-containing protein 19-like [Notolabrus celidotus]